MATAITLGPNETFPDDPDGNLASWLDNLGLLDDTSAATMTAVNLVSTTLGALADAAGGIGAIVAIINAFANANNATLDQIYSALNAISDQIQTDYDQLKQDLGADQILQRNSLIWNNNVSAAFTLFQHLLLAIDVQPPLTYGDKLDNWINPCTTVVNNFMNPGQPDLIWNYDYDWQVYWSDGGVFYTVIYSYDPGEQEWHLSTQDVGYGAQLPTPNADGTTVFAWRYSLPAYVTAITCYLAVAGALDPNFPANPDYQDDLRSYATYLRAKHDEILNNGIVILTPHAWEVGNLYYWSLQGVTGIRVIPDVVGGYGPFGLNPDGTYAEYGAYIEYGAVEVFSGLNEIETSYGGYWSDQYPVVVGDPSGPYKKVQLRALRKAKLVYIDAGLPAVWNTINRLLRLSGRPVMPRPNFADWSVRNEIIPTIGIIADPVTNTFSLKAVASLILHTWPTDTQTEINVFTNSFRTLLTGQAFPPVQSVVAGTEGSAG